MILIFITSLLSWIPNLYDSQMGRFLRRFTDPIENLVRKYIPPIVGLDFSPLIVILICEILRWLLNSLFLYL
jgi:YggT family protein